MILALTINGEHRTIDVAPLTRLIDVLRDTLSLTGTKEGCGEGECGTCTVLLDDEPVNACLVPIGQCAERSVVTIEGLAAKPLADAFVRKAAVQCGICTPGMMVSSHALLARVPRPTELQIREAISGNICRCTGYQAIVDAVAEVAASEVSS